MHAVAALSAASLPTNAAYGPQMPHFDTKVAILQLINMEKSLDYKQVQADLQKCPQLPGLTAKAGLSAPVPPLLIPLLHRRKDSPATYHLCS